MRNKCCSYFILFYFILLFMKARYNIVQIVVFSQRHLQLHQTRPIVQYLHVPMSRLRQVGKPQFSRSPYLHHDLRPTPVNLLTSTCLPTLCPSQLHQTTHRHNLQRLPAVMSPHLYQNLLHLLNRTYSTTWPKFRYYCNFNHLFTPDHLKLFRQDGKANKSRTLH